jgi:hypothetical protein
MAIELEFLKRNYEALEFYEKALSILEQNNIAKQNQVMYHKFQ